MNQNVKRYRKILNKLINKSFIKLKRKKIILSETKYQINNVFAMVIYFGFFVWIIVFPIAKNYSINSLKAVLAHELSHYELILNMTFFEKLIFAFNWLFTKKGKAKFETDADKYAIDKGFGKGLLEYVKIIEKKRSKEDLKKRSKKGYLSSKEIQNYCRNQ